MHPLLFSYSKYNKLPNKTWIFISFLLVLSLILTNTFAQKTVINGIVRDAATNEPLPFVNVYIQGMPTDGAVTDINGNFSISTRKLKTDDNLIASYIGYITSLEPIKAGKVQRVIFKLQEETKSLEEITVKAGDNPAYAIIKNASRNKDGIGIKSPQAISYQSYFSSEVYLNEMKGIKYKVIRQMRKMMEKGDFAEYYDKRGRLTIPLMVFETVSKIYEQKPDQSKEEVISSKATGIGVEPDDGLSKLLTGKSFRDYDFYKNRIRVVQKYFPSPIADSWKVNYEYWLIDSLMMGGEMVYEIDVEPRAESDLAFYGKLWITKKDYAIKKLDLRTTDNVNINYVEYIHIKQELDRLPEGFWVPKNTIYEVSVNGVSERFPGILLRFNIKSEDFVINQSNPSHLFTNGVSYEKQKIIDDESYWQKYREMGGESIKDTLLPHENQSDKEQVLSSSKRDVHAMIDSLKTLPRVKIYSVIFRTGVNGFYSTKYLEFGHWLYTYNYNNIEKSRIGFGFRTTRDLHKTLLLKTWIAYGTGDKRGKYNIELNLVPKWERFTRFGLRRREDLEPASQISQENNLHIYFRIFNRFGNLKRRNPFYYKENLLWVEHEIYNDLVPRITFRNTSFSNKGIHALDEASFQAQSFSISEIDVSLRYARNERAIRKKDNELRTLGPQPYPVLHIGAKFGFSGVFGSNYNYKQLYLKLIHTKANIFGVGTADYRAFAGYSFDALPYPLLRVHQGNRSPFLFYGAHNGMDNFEFVSDYYAELIYTHYFEGWLISRVPGLSHVNNALNLKWRLISTFNFAWGGMTEKNRRFNEDYLSTDESSALYKFNTLQNGIPYMDIGYGVENIFKLLRIDFIHRLSYRDNNRVSNFQVKLSAIIKF